MGNGQPFGLFIPRSPNVRETDWLVRSHDTGSRQYRRGIGTVDLIAGAMSLTRLGEGRPEQEFLRVLLNLVHAISAHRMCGRSSLRPQPAWRE
jgi:hypothetical protein